MCLAVPAQIVELNGTTATISVEGALREIDVSLVEEPRLGDYVLVHAGFAIHKWERSEVEELEAIRANTDLREVLR
ncbi:MAG TPA: HypC/HybG/HupF family hydrogenase formation chaperone [Verrucomicrobiae bacterium]|nr:HypC/HybG/HupF family hydrogenase formation chaperone [Verrucomicrobiae bacterium]